MDIQQNGDTSSENSYMNVGKNPNNYQSFTNEQIEDTPFRLIGNDEQGYALSMGKYRITEPKPTKDEAVDELSNRMWHIILQVVTLTHEIILHELTKAKAEGKIPEQPQE